MEQALHPWPFSLFIAGNYSFIEHIQHLIKTYLVKATGRASSYPSTHKSLRIYICVRQYLKHLSYCILFIFKAMIYLIGMFP